MKIKPIFDPSVYSVETSEDNEFSDFMDEIHDVSLLTDFFLKNIEDLTNGYFGTITVRQAVEFTLKEAESLNAQFLKMDALIKAGMDPGLNLFFKPLNNQETGEIDLQKSKGRDLGRRHKNWVRLYAIKLSNDCYIITGGAIKLTRGMNPPHLQKELLKLDRCRTFFKDLGIFDSQGFYEYIEE